MNSLEVLPQLVLLTVMYTSVRSGVRYALSQTPEIRMSEFDKSRQTLPCVFSLVAPDGSTAALGQWAHRRAGTSDCSGRLVDVNWSSCRCAELGENTLNLSLALSYASFTKSYATEYRFKRLSRAPRFYKLEWVKNKNKNKAKDS